MAESKAVVWATIWGAVGALAAVALVVITWILATNQPAPSLKVVQSEISNFENLPPIIKLDYPKFGPLAVAVPTTYMKVEIKNRGEKTAENIKISTDGTGIFRVTEAKGTKILKDDQFAVEEELKLGNLEHGSKCTVEIWEQPARKLAEWPAIELSYDGAKPIPVGFPIPERYRSFSWWWPFGFGVYLLVVLILLIIYTAAARKERVAIAGMRGDIQNWNVSVRQPITLLSRELVNRELIAKTDTPETQTFGDVKILSPKEGITLQMGKVSIQCEMSKPPDGKVVVLSQKGNEWWPHVDIFKREGNTNIYNALIGMGVEGKFTIHIVAVTQPIGNELIKYYKKVSRNKWTSIEMDELPDGMTSLDSVDVVVVKK